MKLVLMGAPGAGKGTQANFIYDRYGIRTLSTGNILRAAIKNDTEVGRKAKAYMDAGQLVPDDIIIEILKDRLRYDDTKDGFILDGVPRTVSQALALERLGVDIDLVIDLQVNDQDIIERLTGRRVCEKCGTPYHTVYNPSRVPDVCDRCGGKLMIRKDDQPDTVRSRLKTYHEETEPLVHFYQDRGKLAIVVGDNDVEKTTQRVFKVLEGLEKK